MNIVLFGAPGAGKGTQSALLVEHLKMLQISTGDLFRAAIRNGTDLGAQAKNYMDQGQLVPDSIVISMVEEALADLGNRSFILDGFPRTKGQAEALGLMLQRRNLVIGKAIFLEVQKEELLKRLTGRRVCKSCGAVFHVFSKPNHVSGVCDACGGEVVQRSDDKEDVIATRLKAYEESTAPLKDFFKEQGKYEEIDGSRGLEEVFSSIRKAIL